MLAIQLVVFYEVALEPTVSPLNMVDNYCDYLLFLLVDCETLIKITLNIISLPKLNSWWFFPNTFTIWSIFNNESQLEKNTIFYSDNAISSKMNHLKWICWFRLNLMGKISKWIVLPYFFLAMLKYFILAFYSFHFNLYDIYNILIFLYYHI